MQSTLICAATATLGPQAPASNLSNLPLNISFDNEADPKCTVVTVTGPDQANLLSQITGALKSLQLLVVSAVVETDTSQGRIKDVFKVTDDKGNKVPSMICKHAQSSYLACRHYCQTC